MLISNYTDAQKEFMKGKRIMIGTPCYGGMATAAYLQSLIGFSNLSKVFGVEYVLVTLINESLITRARNDIVSQFLNFKDEKGHLDYLMFIDADIQFEPDSVLRLIAHNKDVVAGAYPLKVVNFNEIAKTTGTPEEMAAMSTEYVINVKFASEEKRNNLQVEIEEGVIEVHDAGTGFMLIKRDAILKMIEKYPETRYTRDMKNIDESGRLVQTNEYQYALFDTSIYEDNRYLSEDYTFCRRWQKIGGRIFIDPLVVLNHVGSHMFRGRPLIKNVETVK